VGQCEPMNMSYDATNCTSVLLDRVVDTVVVGDLVCSSNSTLWNHSITCWLNVVRFGAGACFEWDMGDGTPPDTRPKSVEAGRGTVCRTVCLFTSQLARTYCPRSPDYRFRDFWKEAGDGTAPLYYRDRYCAADVPAASPNYVEVGEVRRAGTIFQRGEVKNQVLSCDVIC